MCPPWLGTISSAQHGGPVRTSISSLKLLWHLQLSHEEGISLGLSISKNVCKIKPTTSSTSVIPLLSTCYLPSTVYYLI